MRLLIAICVPLALLAGCGGEDDGEGAAAEATGVSPSEASTPVADEGMSQDCQLAVATWTRAANDAVADAVFEVPFDEPDARDAPTDEIGVYCSKDIAAKVAEVNYELALLNAGLTVCKNAPSNCDDAGNRDHREVAQGLIAEVAGLAP